MKKTYMFTLSIMCLLFVGCASAPPVKGKCGCTINNYAGQPSMVCQPC